MKKLFLIAMTAAVFASCGKKQETTTNLYTPDPETFDYVVDIGIRIRDLSRIL